MTKTTVYETPAECWIVWRGEVKETETSAFNIVTSVSPHVDWSVEGTFPTDLLAFMRKNELEGMGYRVRIEHRTEES